MLSREERSEIALGQIEEAIRIKPRIRVLYHTKGVILGQISKTHESMEFARKRFVQSEQAFRHCLSLYNRDEYAYHGLAQLYLDWARKVSDPAEVAEYVSKAEAVIEEGLKMVRVRDSLWIISSEVQRLIGDHPSYLGALEQAVKNSPEGIVGRYLLGRAYRTSGIPQKSKEILEPVITNHPYEFRSFVEYARAMLDLGEPPLNVIPVLNISTLYGLNDPRFIALLGGLLFMSGQYSKALTVFEESYKKEIPADEASVIQFRPNDPVDKAKPLKLKGKVVAVKAGYAFIEVPGYPRFYCPGSKFGGIILTQGLEVRFEPAFTARGAIADKLEQYDS
jgi:tetratricopeptide (TPR) repeat protein